MNAKKNLCRVATLCALFVVAGCGGGGGDHGSGNSGGNGSVANSGSIPASATSSNDGFIAYMKSIIAGSSETSQPVLLGDAVAPVSETATPSGL